MFKINLRFVWEVYTLSREGRQFAFETEIHLMREVLSEDRRQLGALQGLIEIYGCVEEVHWGRSNGGSEHLAFFECMNTIPL